MISDVDDVCELISLTEDSVLDYVQTRWRKERIYSFVGSTVLLAVNPYKRVRQEPRGEVAQKSRPPGCSEIINVSTPHPFSLAARALKALQPKTKHFPVDPGGDAGCQRQAFIISGDSGAGKTETAKLLISYFSNNFSVAQAGDKEHQGSCGREPDQRQHHLIQLSNSLLEGFGNASTIRNRNSSRFGKFMQFQFCGKDSCCRGAGPPPPRIEISTYLLETSRVCHFAETERCFHVFDYTSSHHDEADDEVDSSSAGPRREGAGETDHLLLHAVAEENEEAQFRKAMRLFFPEAKTRKRLCDRVQGVQLLGEVAFEVGDNDSLRVADADHEGLLERAAGLLSPPPGGHEIERSCEGPFFQENFRLLEDALLRRELRDAGVKTRGGPGDATTSSIKSSRSLLQAEQCLTALRKRLYAELFDLVVARVNQKLNERNNPEDGPPAPAPPSQTKMVGILDIYGFEQLQTNSLEQLCINLANERLQLFFEQNFLKSERELYRKEGLLEEALPEACSGTGVGDVGIATGATAATLENPTVLEIHRVFAVLDDHLSQKRKGIKTSDARFVKDVLAAAGNCTSEVKGSAAPYHDGSFFAISHYAGRVLYDADQWLEKNTGEIAPELEPVLERCAIRVEEVQATTEGPKRDPKAKAKSLSRPAQHAAASTVSPKKLSLTKKYREDLAGLLRLLSSCSAQYVRCFKPNANQEPDSWDQDLMQLQLRQSGTFELVALMRKGWQFRCLYKDVLKQVHALFARRKEDGAADKSTTSWTEKYEPRLLVEALMHFLDIPVYRLGVSRLFLKQDVGEVFAKLGAVCTAGGVDLEKKLRTYINRKKIRRCVYGIKCAVKLHRKYVLVRRWTRKLQYCVWLLLRVRGAWLGRVRRKLLARRRCTEIFFFVGFRLRFALLRPWVGRVRAEIEARREAVRKAEQERREKEEREKQEQEAARIAAIAAAEQDDQERLRQPSGDTTASASDRRPLPAARTYARNGPPPGAGSDAQSQLSSATRDGPARLLADTETAAPVAKRTTSPSTSTAAPATAEAAAAPGQEVSRLQMENQLLKGLLAKFCPDYNQELEKMSGADVVQLLLGGGTPGVAAPANSDRRSMSTRKRSSRRRKSPQKSRSPSRRRKKSERCKPKNKTSDALSRRSASRAKRKRAPKGVVCSSKGRKFQSPGVTASSGPALRLRPDSPDASSSFSSSSSSFDSDEEDFESNTMVLSEDVGAKHSLKPSGRQYRKGNRAHSRVREHEKTSRGARTTVGDAAVVDVARSSASTSASSSSSFSGADFPRPAPDGASRRQVVVSDVCEEDAAPHAGRSALTGCTRSRKIDCRRDDSPPLGTPMRRCSSLGAIDGMLGREDESSDAERTPAVAVSWTREPNLFLD
mmetsp:Transcript_20394/g.51532  ORF Transcript_20394/g.51532 Transcript_20394/m.51532 type:complete len:1377 (-) Transcript_20394:1082-5212(-)